MLEKEHNYHLHLKVQCIYILAEKFYFESTCMMFRMSQKLLLEPEESPTGGMRAYVFLLQQMLIFNVVLKQ